MKPLKDFGKIEEIQGISFKQKLIVMTEQERRELVRAVWERAQKAICSKCGDPWCGENPDSIKVEDWIKESGL